MVRSAAFERLGLLCLLTLPDVLATQAGAQPRRVTGIVLDAASGEPVAGAQVRAFHSNAVQTSGQDGSFSVPGLAPGKLRLLLRAIGYTPLNTTLEIGAHDPDTLRVPLTRLAVSLPELRTDAAASSLGQTGFDDRRLSTLGRFITR